MALAAPLSDLIRYCEKLCDKECCGIESFDFSPVHIASWLQHSRGEGASRGEAAEQTVGLLAGQINDFRNRYGAGSGSDGYESDDDEMNQIFTPQQVDQLADQIETNLKYAVELNRQSDLVQWKPDGSPPSSSAQPAPASALVDALSWRYATKKFDPTKQLQPADIETILQATNLSASSYGLQPYQFLLIEDKSLQEKLVDSSYGQKQVHDAAAVLVFLIRTDIDEAYIQQSARETEQIRELEPGQLDGYAKQMIGAIMGMDDDQRRRWATRQAYIAMGTALAACAMLGVDACPMEGFVPAKYDEILQLQGKGLETVLVLPIGYRARDDINSSYAKVRKPLEEMVMRIGQA